MRLAHIRYQPEVWLHDFAQRGDFAGVVGARLDNGDFMVGAEAQQGFGHADVVVEVTLREEHLIFFAQHGRHEFLGRGLAVRARDLQRGQGEAAAVEGGELLERVEHVGHMNKPFVAFRFGIVHYGVGAACRQCLVGKLIAVERCASQGEEYGAFGAVARVGSHRGVREVEVVKFVDGHIGIIYNMCKSTIKYFPYQSVRR